MRPASAGRFSNVRSRLKRLAIYLTAAAGLGVVLYAVYRIGLDGGLARATFTNTIALREEQKCLAMQDLECLRVHWELRAGIAAEGARRGAATPFPTGVGEELRAYLEWYKAHGSAGKGVAK